MITTKQQGKRKEKNNLKKTKFPILHTINYKITTRT